jgi:hypothetical protein
MGFMENGVFDSKQIMPICLPEDENFKVNIEKQKSLMCKTLA